jgi:hypothetical protein
LTQSITSETGVRYQLPEGWVVDDNSSISNFASDKDAVLDFLEQQKRNARWFIIGNFGTTDTTEVADLAGITTLSNALPVLDSYSPLTYNRVVGSEIITLANGAQAYFVLTPMTIFGM